MVHIELKHALSLHSAAGLNGVEVFFHLERDTALCGEANGVGYELFGLHNLGNLVTESFLYKGEQSGAVLLLVLCLFVVALNSEVVVCRGAEAFFLVHHQGLECEFVGVLCAVKDFIAL